VSKLLVASLLLVLSLATALRLVNLRYTRRHAHLVPEGFEASIDQDTLRKMAAYAQDTARLSLLSDVWFRLLVIGAVWCGALEIYDQWVGSLASSYLLQGILFALLASWLLVLLSLPLELYENFVIEARHGFNHSTAKLYWLDFVKSKIIMTVLLVLVAVIGLSIVKWAGQSWWLLVWAFLFGFQLLITLIAPKFIEPLFVKMTPLQSEDLRTEIVALSNKVGVRVDRIYQVDASRRSGHTNAYFSGFGPVKRVVLFDTLLARLTQQEIVAVLAHELGHWKHRHILKRIAVGQVIMLAACFGAGVLVRWEALPGLVNATSASFFLRVTIALLVGSILEFFIEPLLNRWSRAHEWEADAFATRHVQREHLRTALIKLAKDNLANLHVHPWYAAYHASHPTLPARVAQLSSQP
jgi:STE24 endopeptidase